MRPLKHRVATLETKAAPSAMHIVFAIGDEAEEQARARYGKPIGEDDLMVLIRKPAPLCLEEGTVR